MCSQVSNGRDTFRSAGEEHSLDGLALLQLHTHQYGNQQTQLSCSTWQHRSQERGYLELPCGKDIGARTAMNSICHAMMFKLQSGKRFENLPSSDVCRTCLLILLVIAVDGVFVLEQPALSWFEYFPRFREICSRLRIFRASWYMLHYGGPTPKRHHAYSNSRSILGLNRGKLRGWKKQLHGRNPVRHYRDRQGRKRWVGTKYLKATGPEPESSTYHTILRATQSSYNSFENNCSLRTYPAEFGAKIASMIDEVHQSKTTPRLEVPADVPWLEISV